MANNTQLTDAQRAVLEAFKTLPHTTDGVPAFTQRELAEAAGLDHPQKAVAAVMGLVMKGYFTIT